jgi:hypothetical protein
MAAEGPATLIFNEAFAVRFTNVFFFRGFRVLARKTKPAHHNYDEPVVHDI